MTISPEKVWFDGWQVEAWSLSVGVTSERRLQLRIALKLALDPTLTVARSRLSAACECA